MTYQTNIGLEIHVQLKAKSKMFCGCDNDAEDKAPNTVVCPVCMGFPGVLPVANKQAIEWTIKTALALNCQIARFSKFDRKHYFYPDLPKNFQISQYDTPFSQKGWLEIKNERGEKRKIDIKRVHLEEDAAKLVHSDQRLAIRDQGKSKSLVTNRYSLIDFNRSGTPLMEIVTEPDITSPFEAKVFLRELRVLLRYLGVSEADMEKGQLRCDANVSIRNPKSEIRNPKLGTPVEIKNMNSFKMVERALLYEEKRQRALLEKRQKVERETRGWLDDKGITISQRGKEEAPDYRYFPEPDLPPFKFSLKYIQDLKKTLPELPAQKRERFVSKFKIKEKEATILVSDRLLSDYFEEVVAQKIAPQKAANWILVELLGRLNKKGFKMIENRIKPFDLAFLIKKIETGEISGKIAKDIFEGMFETGRGSDDIIKERGIKLVADEKVIEKVAEKVIKENPKAKDDFEKGKTQALQYLIGQVMRETKGRVSPSIAQKILESKLKK